MRDNQSLSYLSYLGIFSALLILALGWHYPFSMCMRGPVDMIMNIVGWSSYLIGIGFGIKCAWYFREHYENPCQRPLGKPLLYGILSAIFLALPSLIVPHGSYFCMYL